MIVIKVCETYSKFQKRNDPNDYGIIRESLITPQTQNTGFMITQLTTMCSFVILDSNDYIEFKIFNNLVNPTTLKIHLIATTT